ncbi:putative Serine/threonine-protein kinase CTR1 [Cocos nucifera]|uniref:Putative Serine/threonine-protein kinase CTR1 n=1 Tax=Cocos nucifera TaxID=13894 RepID=A0A8K0N7Q8_COCNU|nr:putative Serine/threonine-protein kinase CTR1 [Cocos nucifera]
MDGVMPSPSGQIFAQDYNPLVLGEVPSNTHFNNIYVQTGEEFSMDFLQDQVTPQGVTFRPCMDCGHVENLECKNYQNFHAGDGDLTDILGIRRTESSGYSDVSNPNAVKGHWMDGKVLGYVDRRSTTPCENNQKVVESCMEEYSESGPLSEPFQCYQHRPHGSGTIESPQSGKVKFLCSFGGKILPRPGDGKLRYVGGKTRIISISENLSWEELMQKTMSMCDQPHTIKYQLPGEDLDALISVSSDDDLRNMMEEYCGLEKVDGSQRLRLFLISLGESEFSSIDGRGLQSSSEYQYVVAVNNLLEPRPRRSLSGNGYSSQMGYHIDNSPSFRIDSPRFPCSDVINGTAVPNHAGMFMHHPGPRFFVSSQAALKSPSQSPPFSPRPIKQRDTRHSRNQSYDDQFIAHQPLENYYEIDDGNGLHGAVPKLHPNMHSDVEMPITSKGMPFQYHKHIGDLVNLSFTLNDNDLGEYPCYEKPPSIESVFHSEKSPNQIEDSLSWISGSNGSIGPPQGMPHTYSDSVLQVQNERNPSSLSEESISQMDFTASPFCQQKYQNNLQEVAVLFHENRYIDHPNFRNKLQRAMFTSSRVRPEFAYSSHYPEICGGNESNYQTDYYPDEEHQGKEGANGLNSGSQDYYVQHGLVGDAMTQMNEKGAPLPEHKKLYVDDVIATQETSIYKSKLLGTNYMPGGMHGAHVSSQELESLESSVPTSSLFVSKSDSDFPKKHAPSIPVDGSKTEISIKCYGTAYGLHGEPSEPLNGDVACESGSIVALPPSGLWTKGSLEALLPNRFADSMTTECYGDETPNDLVYASSSDPVSHLPPGIMSQKDNREYRVSGSTEPIGTGLGLNLQVNDPPSWSLFPNPATANILKREVSLLDQDTITDHDSGATNMDHGGRDLVSWKGGEERSICDVHNNVPLETGVSVEDVTDQVPSDIPASPTTVSHVLHEAWDTVKDVTDQVPSDTPASPTMVSHVLHKAVDEVETGETSSPKVTDAESNTPGSVSEDAKTDESDMDESIGDAAIAEIEAIIYGLQIIKNAELEELLELGSGTFGTVYHGKWQGTDVAIKQIKKSSFSGRSSKQEQLTNDFWREAQILSKLHHPNVVAFYGVVPDGAGGTLATVTEHMVNGSLRHVLLRKDS